ncbi:MAG: hypothetical protein A3F90_09330 [Deltaproteobacteria bacterium RIFCSPLOWO2_12_FULL_60_19]|nr:MAG: hypothetical protein A3F90_09330 [Deltaproteobacteria bacterium RIFCSPLOWO2_12_FULL_60_19]
MKLSFFLSALLAAAAPVLFHSAAHACAVCLSGSADDPLTDAFNWSVLFLMAMPYTVLGSIGAFLFYNYRRSTKRASEPSARTTIAPLTWIHKESGR